MADIDPLLHAQQQGEDTPKFETRVIKVDPEHFEDHELEEAVKLLKAGEVVAFPTETVYGLGANALDGQACKKIFAAKRRPGDNPLITHISSMDMLSLLVSEVPPKVTRLLEESQFWPGPLTILFPKGDNVPEEVSAGQPTVGVRMPNHPVAKRLIELAGVPIAAPSANSSGRPSPTTANHVYTDLKGRIPCIVDGGDAMVGVESTVLDMRSDPPMILRPGGITQEQLQRFLPDVRVYGKEGVKRDLALEQAPPTPGLKYRHYSPTARVVLLECTVAEPAKQLTERIQQCLEEKKRVGLIRTTGHGVELPFKLLPFVDGGEKEAKEKEKEETCRENVVLVYSLGEGTEKDSEVFAAAVANGLFKALRALDGSGVDVIFVEGISEGHAGLAVMNRLRKAASEIVS